MKKTKRLAAVLFSALLLVNNCWAEVLMKEGGNFTPLSNRSIHSILSNHLGNDWHYFQPSPRETDVDCSSDSFLEKMSVYPILAVKDRQKKLILLKKEEGSWKISTENDSALMRNNYELASFSIDENINFENQHYDVFFEFNSQQYQKVSLQLVLNPVFSYFRSIDTIQFGELKIRKTTVYEPYRGVTFHTDYYTDPATCFFSNSYSVQDSRNNSFSAEEFHFMDVPIEIDELFSKVVCSAEVQLYMAPFSESKVQMTVLPGNAIYIIEQDESKDWAVIQFNGNKFFCKTSELVISRNRTEIE